MVENEGPKRFDPTIAAPTSQTDSDDTPKARLGEEQPAQPELEMDSGPRAAVDLQSGEAPISNADLKALGSDLARVMQNEGYHPVVLFGTNNSGKTSILMSLFATITNEPVLDTGLSLCDPILGSRNDLARELHREAQHTFEIKTQAFLAGEKIPKTRTRLPFFVPVEFRPPDGKQPIKFAFLESNGEWYRPLISDGRSLNSIDKLYPDLREEIEGFISGFQDGITFIYAAPVTQAEVYSASENTYDNSEIHYASLAIKGVLQIYDRIRANGRANDKHLMLLTKWDHQSARAADRSEGIEEDHADVQAFCQRNYAQALAAFQGLNLSKEQRNINAYCAGMINERGLLPLKHDDPVRGVIASYPVRLWTYLYKNAMSAAGEVPQSPFREPPKPSALANFLTSILNKISG